MRKKQQQLLSFYFERFTFGELSNTNQLKSQPQSPPHSVRPTIVDEPNLTCGCNQKEPLPNIQISH